MTPSISTTPPGPVSPGTEATDPFSAEFAQAWLESLITGGVLKPGTVLVPAASMAPTAAFLGRRGFRVKLIDTSEEALREARRQMKTEGVEPADSMRQNLLQLKAWHLGTVHGAVDHELFAGLAPEERFGYVNRMGRLIPTGGFLAGIYRVGERDGGPPRAVRLDELKRLFLRYFTPEILELAAPPQPGHDQAWSAFFKRK